MCFPIKECCAWNGLSHPSGDPFNSHCLARIWGRHPSYRLPQKSGFPMHRRPYIGSKDISVLNLVPRAPAGNILHIKTLNKPAVLQNMPNQSQPAGWNDTFICKLYLKMRWLHKAALFRYTVLWVFPIKILLYLKKSFYSQHPIGKKMSGRKHFVYAD